MRQLFSRLDAQRVGHRKKSALRQFCAMGVRTTRRSRAADDHVRAGVADDILEFRCRMETASGGDAPARRPTLRDCVLESGWNEERNARLRQVFSTTEQCSGYRTRRSVEVCIGMTVAFGDHRNAILIHTYLLTRNQGSGPEPSTAGLQAQ